MNFLMYTISTFLVQREHIIGTVRSTHYIQGKFDICRIEFDYNSLQIGKFSFPVI